MAFEVLIRRSFLIERDLYAEFRSTGYNKECVDHETTRKPSAAASQCK